MFNLMLVALCLGQLMTVPYDQALRESEITGKPVLVIVQQDNCPPCVTMKRDVLEPMAAAGELDGIILAALPYDEFTRAMSIRMTPSLVAWRKRGDKWTRYTLQGRQSLDRVRQLVKRMRE